MGLIHIIKKITITCGSYNIARWIDYHLIHRNKLYGLKKSLTFYDKFISKGDLVFDIGANTGVKTEIFLLLKASVIAVEPIPDCMAELIARCGKHNNLITITKAVSSAEGYGAFYIRSYRNVSSFLKDWEGKIENKTVVSIITLHDLINRYGKPSFCKIDVEGFEYEVISGLKQCIPLISFEYHYREPFIQKTIDILDYLSQFGELEINLTLAENIEFEFNKWKNREDFLHFFINILPNIKHHYYGDIYVRTSTN